SRRGARTDCDDRGRTWRQDTPQRVGDRCPERAPPPVPDVAPVAQAFSVWRPSWARATARDGSASRAATLRERDYVGRVARVEDVVAPEPALARHRDAELRPGKTARGMRVGSDFDGDAQFPGALEVMPVEVEPMRIGIDFDRDAHVRG